MVVRLRMCENLKQINVSEDNRYHSSLSGVLYDKNQFKLEFHPRAHVEPNFDIPETVNEIGDFAFSDSRNMTSVNVPDSVEILGTWAFNCCESLITISLPQSVTSIGDGAFLCCTNLENIVMPDSALYMGDSVFEECVSLTSINIPKGITTIRRGAFFDCRSLEGEVVIPDGVTEIEEYAFDSCSSIESMIIPDTVTTIGQSAFSSCSNLTICGESGSYAETYANENGIPFQSITGEKKAIIVVPGIMGSELYLGGRNELGNKVWVFVPRTFEIACNQDGSSVFDVFAYSQDNQYGVLETYKNLCNRLKTEFGAGYDIIFWPYDWRMSNSESAKKLKNKIDVYDKCVIVAHSMGGLVTSSYVEQYQTEAKSKIEKVITLGTPYLGAPQFLYVVETGYFNDIMERYCF